MSYVGGGGRLHGWWPFSNIGCLCAGAMAPSDQHPTSLAPRAATTSCAVKTSHPALLRAEDESLVRLGWCCVAKRSS